MITKVAGFWTTLVVALGFSFAANAAYTNAGLNMRSGPGTHYGVITTVPANTYVRVYACGHSWCRVRVGHIRGYMSAKYLSLGSPRFHNHVVPTVRGHSHPHVSGGDLVVGGALLYLLHNIIND